MSNRMRTLLMGVAVATGAAGGSAQAQEPLTALTSDGVTIHGEAWLADLPTTAPLILLFHQGGSSGRGEYAPIAPWLVDAGYRVIAWDQRAGGDLHGVPNRTVAGLPPSEQGRDGFCHAMPDVEAALAYVRANRLADRVVVWGSSYSGSLVFGAAAANPEAVSGVIAFSPASGGPVEPCRARRWAADVEAPMFVLRPASEMERAPSLEQRDVLVAAGARFHVVADGVHGSSMLVDERTGSDMAASRQIVLDWLASIASR